jgi:hypothetical protein
MYLRQAGVGTFASPAAVEEEVRKYYRVALIGRLDSAKENFNAISAELKINHPAIAAISRLPGRVCSRITPSAATDNPVRTFASRSITIQKTEA